MSRPSELYQPVAGPPRTLIDKLGVKPEAKVVVLGVHEASFREQLARRTGAVSARPARNADLIFLGTESSRDLKKLASFERFLRRDGGIWVVAPRGSKDVTTVGVIAAGRAAGLTDVKVVRFSETHTSLKFVIPVARR